MINLVKLEHSGKNEWALEWDDCFVIIEIRPDLPAGCKVTYPAGQLEKWERLAKARGTTVEQIVTDMLDAAFGEDDES